MRNPYLHAIFCDDVLNQTNGKVSLISCYGDSMLVGAFPHIHPKLCIQISMHIPPPKEETDVALFILAGEKVLMESIVNISPLSDPPEGFGLLSFSLGLAMERHEFKEPTVLKVTAKTSDLNLESQTLSIDVIPGQKES